MATAWRGSLNKGEGISFNPHCFAVRMPTNGGFDEVQIRGYPPPFASHDYLRGRKPQRCFPQKSDRGELCRDPDGPTRPTEGPKRRRQEIRADAVGRSFGGQSEGDRRGTVDRRSSAWWSECEAKGRLREDVKTHRRAVRP